MKSPFKKCIGIDPGKGGGKAIITDETVPLHNCPRTVDDMALLLGMCLNDVAAYRTQVFLEKVWAFPTDARSRAFNFGVNYGKWLGVIASEDIKPQMIPPKTWQKGFEPLPKEKKKRKQVIKEIAEEMFPTIRVTLYNADALLIGAWASSNCSYEPYSKEEK